MNDRNINKRLQGGHQTAVMLETSAAATGSGTPSDRVPLAASKPTLAQKSKGIERASKNQTPPHSCQQQLKISLFFDGTGNNLEADLHTVEHSNVARLFRAHQRDNSSSGLFRRYIPGIGTSFPEIGDKGVGPIPMVDTHNGMGAMGQNRLDWAFKEVQKIISDAEARAMNPTNKITMISLAVFGFSRGATLARAFVRDLLKTNGGKCLMKGTELRWKQGNYPVEMTFLGLWDTVASVGLPMSANNRLVMRRERSAWDIAKKATADAVGVGVGVGATMLRAVDLAFGEPGADPSPGLADGHADWADGLAIPEAVKVCVHMMAGHEIRNSFPVDSVARDRVKPSNCKEFVYPGAHSNVGGGYRPGEGGRGQATVMDSKNSADADKMLSLIALKAMYDEACAAGVPLLKMNAGAWDEQNTQDFATSPLMQSLFDHYMDTVGRGGRAIGAEFLAHMRMYLAWRFHHIHAKQASGKASTDDTQIAANEAVWSQDQQALDADIAKLKADQQALEGQRMNEQVALRNSGKAVNPKTLLVTPQGQQMAAAINAKYDPKIASLKAKTTELEARKQTLPTQGSLVKGMSEYDRQLLDDARSVLAAIKQDPKKRAALRPHYKNVVETYENEFVLGRGLKKSNESDKKIIDFFDKYVHDSLADFQVDSTLPSDPRVIYAGSDSKVRYARHSASSNQA